MNHIRPAVAGVFFSLLSIVAGCAADRLHQKGLADLEKGAYETGVAELRQAAADDPQNMTYRLDAAARRDAAVQKLNKSYTRHIDQMPSQAVLDEIDRLVDIQHLEDTLMSEGILKFADPQKALLAGLLFCDSCQRPMMATYTAHCGRRYRYYVCHTARQKGWAACPTKSVSAALIEPSVLAQLRIALEREDLREQVCVPDAESQAVETNPHELVRAQINEIHYNGITGSVTLTCVQDYELDQPTCTSPAPVTISGTAPGALVRPRAVRAWRFHWRASKMIGADAVMPPRPVVMA